MIRRLSVPPLDTLPPWLPRRAGADAATRDAVARIIERVRQDGDTAVRALTRELDGVDLAPSVWSVPRASWAEARGRLPAALRSALELAAERVRRYHERQAIDGF